MRKLPVRVVVLLLAILLLALSAKSFAQSEPSLRTPFGVGVDVKVSLLGAGVETAVPVMHRANIRAGFNMLSYDRTFDKDGVSYTGQLRFRSAEAHFDWFPFAGSFRISPGVLIYNGNKIIANAAVPGGDTFTLNDTTYASDPSNPIHGTGKVDFKKAAPMATFGWGNIVPRSGKHFTVPIELGVIFSGSPRAALNLAGGACDSTGANCTPINTDPTFQSNVTSEQAKINKDMEPFKFYPVISVGFGFRF